RHALDVLHVDGAEEEPHPEAAEEPHEGVEAIVRIHQRPRKRASVDRKRPTCSVTLSPRKSTRVPRSVSWSAGWKRALTHRLAGPARTSSRSPRLSSASRVTMT